MFGTRPGEGNTRARAKRRLSRAHETVKIADEDFYYYEYNGGSS